MTDLDSQGRRVDHAMTSDTLPIVTSIGKPQLLGAVLAEPWEMWEAPSGLLALEPKTQTRRRRRLGAPIDILTHPSFSPRRKHKTTHPKKETK